MTNWQKKSCWLYHVKSSLKINQGPGGIITSPTLLGPILVLRVIPL